MISISIDIFNYIICMIFVLYFLLFVSMFVAGGAAVHVPAERHRAGGGQERRGQVAGQPPALQVADQPLAELCIVTIFLTIDYI